MTDEFLRRIVADTRGVTFSVLERELAAEVLALRYPAVKRGPSPEALVARGRPHNGSMGSPGGSL